MTREWAGVNRRDWAAADVRRRENTDYDVGNTVKARKLAEDAGTKAETVAAANLAAATAALVVPPVDAQYVVLAANTTLTHERVLTNGNGISFSDAGAGGALTISTPDVWVVKATNESRSSTTVYAADTDLKFSATSGVYYVQGRILATADSATPDIKISTYSPNTSTMMGSYFNNAGTATVITDSGDAGFGAFDLTSTTTVLIQFDLMFLSAGTGTFGVQWAQNSSSANNTTVKAGSFLRYRKLT